MYSSIADTTTIPIPANQSDVSLVMTRRGLHSGVSIIKLNLPSGAQYDL